MDTLKVSNVVICVKLQELSSHPEKLLRRIIGSNDQVELYHNFSVIKTEAYKYIAFYRSGHVNIIGNRNFEQIPHSIKVFLKFFDLEGEKSPNYRIVNSTWTGKVPLGPLGFVDLHSVQDRCVGGLNHWRCSLRARFPAGVLRHRLLPTCILFKNGKVNIIGAKKPYLAKKAFAQILRRVIKP